MNSTTKCYIVKNDYPMLSTQIFSYVENHKFNYNIIAIETQNIEKQSRIHYISPDTINTNIN